ncbi:ATP-binding protein, partial [Streptacidiphilus sp. MAP5-3]|uniref:sensor histidine kinase n=1 Tax=unclassified Streptacidiphilus TaxID=2643834 RepID=UPI003516CA69
GPLRRALTAGRGIGETTVELSGDIDVHMVTHERAGRGRVLRAAGQLHSTGRRVTGLVSGLVLPALLTAVLCNTRATVNLTSDTLLYLAVVVGVALLGGITSALVASLAASLLLNYYFMPPIHSLNINEPNNALALVVFAVAATVVAAVVDAGTRFSRRAARATAEAETLSALAGAVLRGDQAVPALLARLRETFGMDSVELVERVVAPEELAQEHGAETVPVGADASLVLRGRPLPASDRRVLAAFAAHVAVALERSRLAEVAAEVEPVKAADRLRTALLAAVSHDLRTPLAVALASVTSLRSHEVEFSADDRDELLGTAQSSLLKLNRLVDNLLDMSRLQAGALTLHLQPTPLGEVVTSALDSLPDDHPAVRTTGLDAVPPVLVDPPLLERAIANLTANALRHGEGRSVVLAASSLGDRVELRVVDRGPGLPAEDRDRIFQPFQRLGDHDNTTGVGLGLALSRGLAEAMGGTLTPEDTPGGGLTMSLALPAASPSPGTTLTPDAAHGVPEPDTSPAPTSPVTDGMASL